MIKDKKKQDFLAVLNHLYNIFENKPSVEKMWEEVRMMKFKIRPIVGDISLLDLKNNQLVEILWQLGKLDDFFQKEFKKLSPYEKEVFFKILSEMRERSQEEFHKLTLRKPIDLSSLIEIEIFKEYPSRKKLN